MNQTPSRIKLLLAFAAIYIIWGSTYLAIHFAIDTLPPYLMTGFRFLLSGLFMYAWARLRREASPSWSHWRTAAMLGGLMLFLGMGTVAVAQQWVPSGLTALIIATVPIWMVLIEWIRPGGMRPTGRVSFGIVLSFAGIILLIGPAEILGGGSVNLLGAGLIVLATMFWAAGSIFSRTVTLPVSPIMSTAMQMLTASIMLLITGLLVGEGAEVDLGGISTQSVLAWLYLIVFGSIVAFTAYLWLLQVSTPARVGTYAFVNPVIALFLGWALNSEALTLQTLIAAGMIVFAVIVIITQQQKPASISIKEIQDKRHASNPALAETQQCTNA